MHRIYRGALVQETRFWCTKWTKRCRWYRKETRFRCTNKDKTSVSGQWKETVAEQ